MKRTDAMQLMELHDKGYIIQITDSPYVDSPVRNIQLSEDDGDVVYSSAVFSDRSLLTVDTYYVTVSKVIPDWQHITVEE